MGQIEEFYLKSKEFKPDYYKTWHHFALLNFDAIVIPQEKFFQKDGTTEGTTAVIEERRRVLSSYSSSPTEANSHKNKK